MTQKTVLGGAALRPGSGRGLVEAEAEAQNWKQQATVAASAPWMLETTEKQIAKLATLLVQSPLRFIDTARHLGRVG